MALSSPLFSSSPQKGTQVDRKERETHKRGERETTMNKTIMKGLIGLILLISLVNGVNGMSIEGCNNGEYDFSQLNNGTDIVSLGEQGDGFTYFFRPCGIASTIRCSTAGQSSLCGKSNGYAVDYGSFDPKNIVFSPLLSVHDSSFSQGVLITMTNGQPSDHCPIRSVQLSIKCDPTVDNPYIIEPNAPGDCLWSYSYSHSLACGFPLLNKRDEEEQEEQTKMDIYLAEQ